MSYEMDSLYKNSGCTLVSREKAKNLQTAERLYEVKNVARSYEKISDKFKARPAAREFQQIEEKQYDDTFSCTLFQYRSYIIIACGSRRFWACRMDVKTAVLYIDLEEDIYTQQSIGFSMQIKTKSYI